MHPPASLPRELREHKGSGKQHTFLKHHLPLCPSETVCQAGHPSGRSQPGHPMHRALWHEHFCCSARTATRTGLARSPWHACKGHRPAASSAPRGEWHSCWGGACPPCSGQGLCCFPASHPCRAALSPSHGSCPESTSPPQRKTHGSINSVAGFRS